VWVYTFVSDCTGNHFTFVNYNNERALTFKILPPINPNFFQQQTCFKNNQQFIKILRTKMKNKSCYGEGTIRRGRVKEGS
jgi:hypothetical protein